MGITHEKSWGDQIFASIMKDAMANIQTDTNKNKDEIQSIPQLLGAKNKSAYGLPIPIVLGKHFFTPYYIGMPYTTISGEDGEEQYYNILLLLGYGDVAVTDIKLGSIDLASNKDADGKELVHNGFITVDSPIYPSERYDITLELKQNDEEVSVYPEKVVQEDLEIKLLNAEGTELPVTRFTAQNPRKVQLEFTFPSLIAYDDKSNKKNAEVDLKLEWSPDGSTWYNFGKIEGAESYDAVTGISHFSKQKAKRLRYIAEKTFTYDEVFSQASLNNGRTFELRITRTNAESIDSNVADKVFLTAIRTWCFDYTKSKDSNVLVPQVPVNDTFRSKFARLGLRIKAGDELQGTLNEINMMLHSYARTWNGVEWSTEETTTNNPASLVLKLMQSPTLGNNKYPDSKINLDEFGKFYETCENNGYTCNGVITNEDTLQNFIRKVLFTGRTSLILRGNQYGLVTDEPINLVVGILNNQNIISAENTKVFDTLPSGLRIPFINENNGFQEDEAVVLYEGKSFDDEDFSLDTMELPYITSPTQVVKAGYYELAKRKLRPEIWNRKVTTEGNLYEVGSLLEVQDDTISVGIGDGAEIVSVVIENDYITKIVTDGKFQVTDLSKEYGLKIQVADGVNDIAVIKKKVVVEGEGVYSTFILDEPIYIYSNIALPSEGDVISFGILDRISTLAFVTGKKEDSDGTFMLTVIPYDENVYTADKGDVPEFDSKITSIYSSVSPNIEPPTASKNELMEAVSKIESGEGALPPDRPVNVTAIAERDRIRLSCSAGGDGLNNSIKEFVWQYKKNAEDTWHDLTTDHYYFNHKENIDAYYEREDFNSWYFRVKAVNNYGISSIAWTNAIVDTSSYGTWKLSETVVDTPKNLDRTIILSMSQSARNTVREQYGVVKYQVEVSRYDDVNEEGNRLFFKPAMDKDPYASEDNYKDGEGFVLSSENFVQIVPLKGQSNYQIENTIYHYKITAISTDVETGKVVDTAEPVTKQTIALCTNIRDIVNASEEAKDEIEVRRLSAISAVLGEVRDGSLSGNENNYWTLSTKDHPQIQGDNSDFIGAFRVGGREQFLKVIPKNIVNGVPQNYEIKFKVGNFEVNTTETQLNNTIYLYDENDYTTHGKEGIEPYHTKRLFLSYQGITIQKNSDDATSDENGIWSDVGRITVDEKSNLYITNTNIEDKDFPKIKTFINGIIYHFDTNFLTEKSQSEEETIISGNLTGDDSTPIKEVSLNVLNGTISRTFEKDEEMFCLIKNARLSLGGDIIPESGYTLTDYKNVKKIPARFFVYKE